MAFRRMPAAFHRWCKKKMIHCGLFNRKLQKHGCHPNMTVAGSYGHTAVNYGENSLLDSASRFFSSGGNII